MQVAWSEGQTTSRTEKEHAEKGIGLPANTVYGPPSQSPQTIALGFYQ